MFIKQTQVDEIEKVNLSEINNSQCRTCYNVLQEEVEEKKLWTF